MVRQLTECSLACFLSALEFNWACVAAYHAIKLQCHRPCACSASTFAICLCSVSILCLRLKNNAPDIFFDCSDIPGAGGGGRREVHQQIWRSMSHFLWCSSNQTSHCVTHHGSLWLMTAAIVGPPSYDLLIKFVFKPRELVRHVALRELQAAQTNKLNV